MNHKSRVGNWEDPLCHCGFSRRGVGRNQHVLSSFLPTSPRTALSCHVPHGAFQSPLHASPPALPGQAPLFLPPSLPQLLRHAALAPSSNPCPTISSLRQSQDSCTPSSLPRHPLPPSSAALFPYRYKYNPSPRYPTRRPRFPFLHQCFFLKGF